MVCNNGEGDIQISKNDFKELLTHNADSAVSAVEAPKARKSVRDSRKLAEFSC